MQVEVAALEAGLEEVRSSPLDGGIVELIAVRTAVGERATLQEAMLGTDGVEGDNWRARGSRHTDDGSPYPGTQVTLMNARAIALLAGEDRERWALAGDQLYVDLNLSHDNLPGGTRLAVGDAVIEINELPHRGCKKFSSRFGVDALKFVNSKEGVALNLRGIFATVVTPGIVRVGDTIAKLDVASSI